MSKFIGGIFRVRYLTHRGVDEYRYIRTKAIYVGSSSYYPDPQLLLKVHDYDRKGTRVYCMKNIKYWKQLDDIPEKFRK
jgi:hypothetical protein